jgi:hypothetical protein
MTVKPKENPTLKELHGLKKKFADGNTSIDRTSVIEAVDEVIDRLTKKSGEKENEE